MKEKAAPGVKFWLARLVLIVITCFVLAGCNVIQHRLNTYVANIVTLCGIAIIMAVSLNLVNGLAGQFSIGHAGFMSVGAYTGASITYFVERQITHYHVPSVWWMLTAMFAGGVAAALCGLIVGIPSLKLRGDYLAIVTLGFGEIIRVLLQSSDKIHSLAFLGGALGFSGTSASGSSGSYIIPSLSSYALIFGAVVLVIVFSRNLKLSQHGLAFMAVREDEVAAEAMGIPTTKTKVNAFVLSAFFAGVGGVLFAHAEFFNPPSFNFVLSMNYVIMVVLGGSGSITGSVMAAILLTALPEALKPVQQHLGFSDAYRLVIYAILLILMMLLRPEGVFGRGEIAIPKRWRKQKAAERDRDDTSGTDRSTARASAAKPVHPSALLSVEHMTRRFGGLVAVSDVNIQVNQGELVGLIGPNGAGKTTLFNLLTGVYAPSEGEIRLASEHAGQSDVLLAGTRLAGTLRREGLAILDAVVAAICGLLIGEIVGTSIVPYVVNHAQLQTIFWTRTLFGFIPFCYTWAHSRNRRRVLPGLRPSQFARLGISRTFQNIRLFGSLSVLDNVRCGSYLRRKTSILDGLLQTIRLKQEESDGIALADQLLRRFQLYSARDATASSLPYGDQRRLEIVRALATRPRLLLLDEPAAGMNPQEKEDLMHLIRDIRDDLGLTILLIEHDMKLVMGSCERIYVLDYGRIIAEGTPEEIRNNPAVIAAYLGEDEAVSEEGNKC